MCTRETEKALHLRKRGTERETYKKLAGCLSPGARGVEKRKISPRAKATIRARALKLVQQATQHIYTAVVHETERERDIERGLARPPMNYAYSGNNMVITAPSAWLCVPNLSLLLMHNTAARSHLCNCKWTKRSAKKVAAANSRARGRERFGKSARAKLTPAFMPAAWIPLQLSLSLGAADTSKCARTRAMRLHVTAP